MQLISSKPISHQIFIICIYGIAFFSIDAYADQYNHCTSTQKLGLAKDFRKGVLGWIATVKEEIKGEGAGFIDFAKNKAVIKSMNLLANKLNVNKDGQILKIQGAQIVDICIEKNYLFVQAWIDDGLMQQANAIKSTISNSLGNNPTPRNANITPSSKESDSTIDIENLVKEMQRSQN